jgi:hypothetical protein
MQNTIAMKARRKLLKPSFSSNVISYPHNLVLFAHGDDLLKVLIYKFSTFSLAQGVLRKNFSDDFTEGSLLKQLILILPANPSQS